MKPVIPVYVPESDYYTSYGVVALEYCRHLERLGFDVRVWCFNGPAWHASQPEEIQAITRKPFDLEIPGGILCGYPTSYHAYGPLAMQGPRIALTYWESSRLPSGWVEVLNTCDLTVVSTPWVGQVMTDCGVRSPIRLIREGIGEEFSYQPRPEDLPFTVLIYGDASKRKNGWQIAIPAFMRAFPGREDVQMVIKCRPGAGIPKIVNENIEVITADYTVEQMADLYRRCHVLVWPSSGEGNGRPPREFAKTGGLSLVTAWSGQADLLEAWGVPLTEYEMVPAWEEHPAFYGLGVWAKPDIGEAAELLSQAAELPLDDLNAVGLERSQNVTRLYDWSTAAFELGGAWLEVLGNWKCKHATPAQAEPARANGREVAHARL